MRALRPVSALLLLAVALVGGTLAPAAHWASHGLADVHAHALPAEGIAPGSPSAHAPTCPDCAHLQSVGAPAPVVEAAFAHAPDPSHAASAPEAPHVAVAHATPEGRGPPSLS